MEDGLWIFKFDTLRALFIVYIPDKSYSNFIIYSPANFNQFRSLDDGRKFPAVSLLVWLQEIQAYPNYLLFSKPSILSVILSLNCGLWIVKPDQCQMLNRCTLCSFKTSYLPRVSLLTEYLTNAVYNVRRNFVAQIIMMRLMIGWRHCIMKT